MNPRPTKKPEEKRKKYACFRVNLVETAEIEVLAAHYHFSVSEYMRRAALGYIHVDRKEAGLK